MRNGLRRGGSIVVLVVFLCSCSVGVEVDGEVPHTTGCGDAVAPGFYQDEMRYGGRQRSFNVYLPKGYAGRDSHPLLIAAHGGLGTGAILEQQANLSRAADRYGYVVVYPNGVWRSFNAGNCCGAAARQNVDDVGFVAALVDKISRMVCVDQRRVYATGFSNGAMLIHRIACERPGLLTAFASVAGTLMRDACAASEPTPALLIRGHADERIPWQGGVVNGSYRRSMAATVDLVAQRNRCGSAQKTTFEQGAARCHARLGCAAPLRWCVIAGVGHQWPGGGSIWPALLGANSDDYDATERIFKFFEAVGAGP